MPQGQPQQQPQPKMPNNPMAGPGQALDRRNTIAGGNLKDHIAKDPRMGAVFSAPIPGQSWTMPPKSAPWEHPPQYTTLEKAMNFLMDQLLEPHQLKHLLTMMDGGMAIEAIARTLIFAGFQQGMWNPDLGMMMLKPLMLALIAIAHRANLKHVPLVLKQTMDKHLMSKFKNQDLFAQAKDKNDTDKYIAKKIPETMAPVAEPNNGFMRRT